MSKRYFIDHDNSGHAHVVEADRREDWQAWLALPEDDPSGWEAPEFATRCDVHPSCYTFTDPQED